MSAQSVNLSTWFVVWNTRWSSVHRSNTTWPPQDPDCILLFIRNNVSEQNYTYKNNQYTAKQLEQVNLGTAWKSFSLFCQSDWRCIMICCAVLNVLQVFEHGIIVIFLEMFIKHGNIHFDITLEMHAWICITNQNKVPETTTVVLLKELCLKHVNYSAHNH